MRTAIVTGGAKGIGKAIAGRLAHDGFTVVVADVDEPAAITEAAVLSGMGIGVDVSDSAAAKRMAATVLHRYGSIDVLVNNAGITGKAAPVHEYPDDEWRRVMAIDLDGVFYCTKAVLPSMLAKGSGRIINIASISGKEGNPNMPAYSTAKAGVIGFTKALGKEVATRGVYVNCITPAVIETWNVGMSRVVGIGWRRGLANSEQIAAQLQVSSAEAIGQKTELADADQAGR